MSVTMTAYSKVFNEKPNFFRLNCSYYGAGDGTGGTVDYNSSISAGNIKPDDRLLLRFLTAYQDDANTTSLVCTIQNAQWSALATGALENLPMAVAYGGTWFNNNVNLWLTTRQNTQIASAQYFDFGKSLVENPAIQIVFTPNTNGKFYRVFALFDVFRKPS